MPFVFKKQRKNQKVCSKADARAIREALGDRSIVLVGLMGAGKTAIGRRLAQQLNIPFTDADDEIEQAAGKSISDIFAEDGEDVFKKRRETRHCEIAGRWLQHHGDWRWRLHG